MTGGASRRPHDQRRAALAGRSAATAITRFQRTGQFRVLSLDTKERLHTAKGRACGTVHHTPVYPREAVRLALKLHATALSLLREHPSGDSTPSMADREMTGEIEDAAATLSVASHDHTFTGNGMWVSFRREGPLEGRGRLGAARPAASTLAPTAVLLRGPPSRR
jgi:DNA repair protein RadC